jgi:hypothetical protein
VQVRRSEGVAIHIGPKPCAGLREDVGEASAGERIGQPLSRESDFAQGADEVSFSEGNTVGHASASVCTTSMLIYYGRPSPGSSGMRLRG